MGDNDEKDHLHYTDSREISREICHLFSGGSATLCLLAISNNTTQSGPDVPTAFQLSHLLISYPQSRVLRRGPVFCDRADQPDRRKPFASRARTYHAAADLSTRPFAARPSPPASPSARQPRRRLCLALTPRTPRSGSRCAAGCEHSAPVSIARRLRRRSSRGS